MIAALAHEIKNPLNSMKGAAEFLNQKYGSQTEIKEFTGIILDEIDRLDTYLNEFLSFSRGTRIRLKQVNVGNFIAGIVMTMKHSFPAGLEFSAEPQGVTAEMDPEQIRQVLVNLLSNAKDACASVPGGASAFIRAWPGKKCLFISVSDQGTGISREIRKKIFDPFFTTKENGIGIGLAICRAIIEKHRGRIKVKSAEGKGAEFIIELPWDLRRKINA